MNIYKVPFDFTHEEKVFGGYLSLRQMLYLVLSIVSIGVLFFPILPIILKFVIFLIITITLLIFAFLKIGTTYADRYFFNIIKYLCRNKIYIHERK